MSYENSTASDVLLPGELTHDGCVVVKSNVTAIDNPNIIVSREAEFWVSTVITGVLSPLLLILGLPGNVLSMAVFYRQGLQTRINMCLFVLALTDAFVVVIFFLIFSEFLYRGVAGYSTWIYLYLKVFVAFGPVSRFLSLVVACERCFCVVSPLKAQRLLKTSTMAVIITVSSAVIFLGQALVVAHQSFFVCFYDVTKQERFYTMALTEFYRRNMWILYPISVYVYSLVIPFSNFTIIVTTTTITAIKLRTALSWRRQTSTPGVTKTSETAPVLSSKEIALTKMLVGTSVFYIACVTPYVILQLVSTSVPDLLKTGRFVNLQALLWNSVQLLKVANSSFNFCVYYAMGSRFRETLWGEVLKRPKLGEITIGPN